MGGIQLRVRAEWRRSKVSLLALTLLVAVVGAVTFTALAGARRTRSSMGAFDRANHTTDLYIDLAQLDTTRGAAEIAALPEVAQSAVYGVPSILPITNDGAYLPLLAPMHDPQGARLEQGVLLEGRRALAADEIVLSVAQASVLHARVGDEIPYARFGKDDARRCLFADDAAPRCDAIFKTTALRMRVVGIARAGTDLVNRVRDVSLSSASPAFYARYRDATAWSPALLVKLRPGVTVEQFENAARRVVPADINVVYNRPNRSSIIDAVDVLAIGLAMFGAIAGLAGALAIAQAVRRQALRPASDDAVLRAMGAARGSRIVGVVAIFGPVAAAGLTLAVLAAWLASSRMPIGLARRVDPRPHLTLDLLVVGIGAALLLALIVGVAAVATVRTRRTPAVATSHAALGARLSTSIADPRAAVGLRYATVRGKGPDAVPVRSAFLATVVAVAGVVAVLAFAAGLQHLVHTPAMYGWNWNVVLGNDHRDRVLADPGVGTVAEIVAQVPLQVEGRATLAMSVTPLRGKVGPAIVAGRAPATRDEIALGSKTMSALHARIGDAVHVRGLKGAATMRVVGQGVFPTTGDAYPLADGAYVAAAALPELGTGDSSQGLGVVYRPGTDTDAAYARLTAIDLQGRPNDSPPDRAAPPAEVENLRRVESLPLLLAGFLALLGIIAVAHALIVSVRRRGHELATLRVLGFRPRDVALSVAWQAALLALAGAVIGMPLGILLGRVAWRAVANRTGVLVVHRLPVLALAIVIPVAVLVAVIAAVVPARRAARLRPAVVLRSE